MLTALVPLSFVHPPGYVPPTSMLQPLFASDCVRVGQPHNTQAAPHSATPTVKYRAVKTYQPVGLNTPSGPRGALRSLTVVLATDQTLSQAFQHAATIALSPSWLVKGALILAASGRVSGASLARHASLYPHAWKAVCRLPDGGGARCGQFATWHRLAAAWGGPSDLPSINSLTKLPTLGGYDVVLLLQKDVYLTPLALRILEGAIADSPDVDLFLPETTDAVLVEGNQLLRVFNAELVAFRPRGNLSTRIGFWGRVLSLCTATDPLRRSARGSTAAPYHSIA
jgi:hypothetical protein